MSICRKSRIYAFGKREYEEDKCLFVEGEESNFVLKKAKKKNKTKSEYKKLSCKRFITMNLKGIVHVVSTE